MPTPREKEFFRISSLFQAGKMPAAEAAAKDALRRYPRDFYLHNILGAISGSTGRWKESARHFAKAVKFQPKSFEGFRNLGNSERQLGNLVKAQGHLTTALKLNQNFAAGWCSLGVVYLDRLNIPKATDAFNKALALQPNFVEAAINLMTITERANQLDDLRGILDRFNAAAPGHPLGLLFGGILQEREGEYEAAREGLKVIEFDYKRSEGNLLLEMLRVNRLGKINDRLHNTDEAFALFAKAKEMSAFKARRMDVDASRYQAALAARIDYHKSDFSAGWATKSDLEDEPVFMIGFPRSGTTLLDTFLSGHPDISVIEEKPLVVGVRQVLGTFEGTDMSVLDRLDSDTINKAAAVFRKAQRLGGNTKVVIDKLPLNITHVGEILRVFPKARFILSVRDPADSVFSNYMQAFKPNDAMASMNTPLSAAQTYDSAMQIWTLVEKHLKPAFIVCRYEDLIADPEAALTPVISFLDLPWDDNILSHSETAKAREQISTPSYSQVVQPLYSTAKGRWLRYAHLMPEALEILEPWRKHFSYCD